MNADSIQIKCEKWQILAGVGADRDLNEVNFFSNAIKFKLEEINLMEYCLDDEFPISAKGEDIDLDTENASLELFRNYGNINLKLSNIKSYDLANSFFRIYDDDYLAFTSEEIRYKIRVLVKGKLKFQGTLTTYDIKHAFPKEINSREVINVPVYSWDKEFETYYKNKKMPDLSSVTAFGTTRNIWNHSITIPYYGTFTTAGSINVDNVSIYSIMIYAYSLPSNMVQFDSGIDGDRYLGYWSIMRIPQFIKPAAGVPEPFNAPIYLMATGYDYIRDNLQYNMFDFLKYMCNAQGWVFYWEIIGNDFTEGELKLIIRNRVTADNFFEANEVLELDYNKIIDFDVSFSEYTVPVNMVKTSVVEFTGGGKAFEGLPTIADFDGDANKFKGAGDRVFTSLDIAEPNKNILFFNQVQTTSTPSLIVDWDNDYIHSKYSDSNADKQHYIEFKNIAVSTSLRGERNYKDLYFDNNDVLQIKCGDNNFNLAKKRRVDLSNNIQTDYHSGDEISDYDLIFTGNIASAMYYETSPSPIPFLSVTNNNTNNITPHYQSEQYEENFRALLSDVTNKVIELDISGIYDANNTFVVFNNISGTEDEDKFSGEFSIVERTVDYINEVTKLKLKKRY